MPEARLVRSAAALLIGNELLSGKVHEANLVELARTLRALGIELCRVVVISDDVDQIAGDVRALAANHDVVFTSGGVGPTHDDVTMEGIARAFGVGIHSEPTLHRMLSEAFGQREGDAHLRMALIPEGAELMQTSDVRWPTIVMRNVWVLPGVPEIFRMKLAVAREWLRGPTPFTSRAAFMRMEEVDLKELIDRVVLAHPEVSVGSYPKWFDATYKTKVTFDARDPGLVDRALGDFLASLPAGEPQRVE